MRLSFKSNVVSFTLSQETYVFQAMSGVNKDTSLTPPALYGKLHP